MSTIIVWEVEEWNGADFSLHHFPSIWLGGFGNIFAKTNHSFLCQKKWPTIALLLHRISHVAQCVCILTKALPLFILLLKIVYVELIVRELEACTCFTYIAKTKIGSWRWHSTQSDQYCARVWRVDDENERPLLWNSFLNFHPFHPLFGRLEDVAISFLF